MLQIEQLTVCYPGSDTPAVQDLSLTAADGEVVTVIGPSGCGKSTLLRAVAGLQPARNGRVCIDGEDVTTLRPDQRGVGLMFQDHALFPHRSVGENVAFGLRMQRVPRPEINARVDAVIELVGLQGAHDRSVTALSGGERQRVALARAIAPGPRLLMLDEPLGSLDRALQDRLLAEFPRVFSEIGTTVVYVTHDQQEALALADRVAVMRDGRLLREGIPADVWRDPRSGFVAEFLGVQNLVDVVAAHGVVVTPWGPVPVDDGVDGRMKAALLPDAVRLVGSDVATPHGHLALDAVVRRVRFAGDHLRVEIEPPTGPPIRTRAPTTSSAREGDTVRVTIDPAGVTLMDPST